MARTSNSDTALRRPAAHVAVALSAIGFGLGPHLARMTFAAGVDPAVAGFARMALLAVGLAPFAGRAAVRWGRESILAAAGGAGAAIGFTLFLVGVTIDPFVATVVYYTYPLVVIAGGWLSGDRPALPDFVRAAAIVIGVGMCVGPSAYSAGSMRAALFAAAAPLTWAVFLTMLSGRLATVPALPKLFSGAAGGAVALLPAALVAGAVPSSEAAWHSIGLLALCSGAVPGILVTWGAPMVGAPSTAFIGSFEFLVALTVGWASQRTAVPPMQAIGAGIILAAALSHGGALLIVPTKRRPRKRGVLGADPARHDGVRSEVAGCEDRSPPSPRGVDSSAARSSGVWVGGGDVSPAWAPVQRSEWDA